jgi:hypothetical protein
LNDNDFYSIWNEEDKPIDQVEKQSLEIARLRAELEVKSKMPEKVYIVKGYNIFVCHKSQVDVDKRVDKETQSVLRDITIKDARVVVYGPEGLKKLDKLGE